MRPERTSQSGVSTVATIAAFVGFGLIFLVLIILTISSGGKKDAATNDQKQTSDDSQASTSNEPAYIRVPENSKIYDSKTYGFLFAYPDSFGDLTAKTTNTSGASDFYQAESGLAAQKPVGNGTAFMNGRLGVYVSSKEDFKISVNSQDVQVAPTATGQDVTWKIVSRGNSSQDMTIGSSYTVKSVKSQTGIPVFDFTYRPSGSLALSRWVFAAGDKYVMVTLPSISKPSGDNLTDQDVAAYTIIGNNIAKTVRVPSANTKTDTTSTGTKEDSSSSTTTTNN